jgi:hypothetical protein
VTTLTSLGRRVWPTFRHTPLDVSPDALCGVEGILAGHRARL